MMRIVVITDVPFTADEAGAIGLLLDEGVDRVHLRKPQSGEQQMRRLIESLPERYYGRITLQDHLPLAVEYGMGGVHLNSRNGCVPDGFAGLVSRSCHSLDEVAACAGEDYLFLSPIFDSISKAGYCAAFTDDELRRASACGILGERVVALGGVRPHNLPLLREYGFGGAALLGCIWRDPSPAGIRSVMAQVRRFRDI